jgi:hypothetical protein
MEYVNVARAMVTETYELPILRIVHDVSYTVWNNDERLLLEDPLIFVGHFGYAEAVHRYAVYGARSLWWLVAHAIDHYACYDVDADPSLDLNRIGEETHELTGTVMESMRGGADESGDPGILRSVRMRRSIPSQWSTSSEGQ